MLHIAYVSVCLDACVKTLHPWPLQSLIKRSDCPLAWLVPLRSGLVHSLQTCFISSLLSLTVQSFLDWRLLPAWHSLDPLPDLPGWSLQQQQQKWIWCKSLQSCSAELLKKWEWNQLNWSWISLEMKASLAPTLPDYDGDLWQDWVESSHCDPQQNPELHLEIRLKGDMPLMAPHSASQNSLAYDIKGSDKFTHDDNPASLYQVRS